MNRPYPDPLIQQAIDLAIVAGRSRAVAKQIPEAKSGLLRSANKIGAKADGLLSELCRTN